jgi:hypothetical protein
MKSKPRRCSKAELNKVGVDVISESNMMLRCRKCTQWWSPNIRTGGKMPARYWICPNGCNSN